MPFTYAVSSPILPIEREGTGGVTRRGGATVGGGRSSAHDAWRGVAGVTIGTYLLVVLLVLSAGAWSTPLLTPRLPWAVLVAGFAATGAARIRLRLRSASHEFVVDELAIVVGIFTATPLALASAAGFATLGWQLWRRRPLLKASFNVGIAMLEASVAAWVAHGLLAPHTELGPAQWGVSWLAVLLAMSASTLLIRRVIALTADSGMRRNPRHRRSPTSRSGCSPARWWASSWPA